MRINNKKPYLLIAPVFMIISLIMGLGIINAFLQSIGYMPHYGIKKITIEYYINIFTDKVFLKSLIFSFKICFISTFISVLSGVLLAYMFLNEKLTKLRFAIMGLPILVPHIVVVTLIIAIFSNSGIISRILFNLNIINDIAKFPSLVWDKNGIGIIFVYVWKGIPFVFITAYNVLKQVDKRLLDVADDLGANKIQTFKYVIFPMIKHSVISSFLILFAFSFGSFEVPFLIGATTPKALPVLAYIKYSSIDMTQKATSMAINTVLSIVSIFILHVYSKKGKAV